MDILLLILIRNEILYKDGLIFNGGDKSGFYSDYLYPVRAFGKYREELKNVSHLDAYVSKYDLLYEKHLHKIRRAKILKYIVIGGPILFVLSILICAFVSVILENFE